MTTLKAKDDVISRINDNNTVIIMKADDSDVFFKIHGLAANVWKDVIDGDQELSAFVDNAAVEFNVDKSKIESDIADFFKTLEEKGLVE